MLSTASRIAPRTLRFTGLNTASKYTGQALKARSLSTLSYPNATQSGSGISRRWAFAIATCTVLGMSLSAKTYLDADVSAVVDTIVDPATSIEFPKTLRIPSKFPLPQFTLVGVGVRTVSFLKVKVYSIGFYADLSNPNLKIPENATTDEKIEYLVRNTACVVRIVPVRNTSHTHLRDGFVRALTARINIAKAQGTLSRDAEFALQSPLREFKSMFPNTPRDKGDPMDILLTGPSPDRPRSLIIRDMGYAESTWLVEQFLLAYFDGAGISTALKKSVSERLEAPLLSH